MINIIISSEMFFRFSDYHKSLYFYKIIKAICENEQHYYASIKITCK